MLRKIFFWLHLSMGVTAGLFIFIMAATGVLLSFERQTVAFIDRNVRTVSNPQDGRQRPIHDLIDAVQRAGIGEPTAMTVSRQPQAAIQFSIGRGKTIYVDPYTGAVLGASSLAARSFFSQVERLHRTLGAPQGSKGLGHWLAAVSNLLFAVLILLGIVLWLPRRWSWAVVRASSVFRAGLKGKAREWNWHNVLGIWCAVPLFVIALTGVVMSFDWANALLFRITGSPPPARGGREFGGGDRRPRGGRGGTEQGPDYDRLVSSAKKLDPAWRLITVNLARGENTLIAVSIDTGSGGQPQKRTQYLLNRTSNSPVRTTRFADGSLGQRLRAFVRFGHTGEYGGWLGQAVAALVSFGACVLVYSGISLSIRRLRARLRRKEPVSSDRNVYASPSVV